METEEQKQSAKLEVLPDSSWLIAVIDDKDSHHKAALSSLGAMKPYKPMFYVAPIVYLETISRLITKNNLAVKKCYDKVQKFISSIDYKHKTGLDLGEVEHKFKTFSRIRISKKLSAVDFYVVAEGMLLEAKILTCDLKMYRVAKDYYEQIYFLTDQVKGYKSDLGRLISDIQNS